MRMSEQEWIRYRDRLSTVNRRAAELMQEYMDAHGYEVDDAMVEYAWSLATKYGEAAAELSCIMYDDVAEASGKSLEPAVPAPTATFSETAKAVRGTAKKSPEQIAATVGQLVKQAGADTTLQNAARDGAEFAWVPHGDTCVFCKLLASKGWQKASKKTVKKGHVGHIHSNCDCEYAVRFDGESTIEGYEPEKILAEFESAEGDTWQEKMNSMRREQYAEDPEKYLAPKREKYRLKTGKMPSGEYYLAKKYWNEVEELDLPQKEREYVYEQFDEWLTDEEKQSAIVRKAIGNYYYQAVHLGHNQYKIYIKERIVPYEDWFDEVMTEVIGPDWRRYDF